MKKSLIFVGMLAIGYANAQEGNVGINTENPKATLDITPEANNLTGTTNEGLLIPRLSKARVAAIAPGNLVEGTKVYVTDEVTAADTQFIGTGKGFYFYNGTKWVKQLASDTDTNSELWAQRDNAGIIETYLKPAATNGDEVYYSKKEHVVKMGGYLDSDADWKNINGDKGYGVGEVPYFIGIRSAALPANSTVNKTGTNFNFSNEIFKVEEPHASAGSVLGKTYWGKEHRIIASDVTSNLGTLRGLNSSVDLFSSNNTSALSAGEFVTAVGNEKGDYTPTLNWNIGLKSNPRIYPNSKVTTTYGLEVTPSNYGGSSTNMYGIRTNVTSTSLLGSSTVYPTTNYTNLIGNYTTVMNRTNTTVASWLRGIDIRTDYENGSIITGEAAGLMVRGYAAENSNINTYIGVNSHFNASGALTMKDFYAFRFSNSLNSSFNPENMYGLYLANVNKGTALNYAIYTNAGEVSFGGKVNIRNTTDVALDTGTPAFMIGSATGGNIGIDNNEIMARNNGAVSPLYLQIDGGDVMINSSVTGQEIAFKQGKLGVGVLHPTETLEVAGNVKTTSLAGTGTRNVVADENGVLRVGEATATGATTLTGEASLECNASNRGKMNFIQGENGKSDVFGICMKNKDGNYYWGYMVGGNNPTNGTGAFGSGL